MAQGQFTKEEARETATAVTEMFNALPKGQRGQFLGHLNDIALFLSAAERATPAEAVAKAEANPRAEAAGGTRA